MEAWRQIVAYLLLFLQAAGRYVILHVNAGWLQVLVKIIVNCTGLIEMACAQNTLIFDAIKLALFYPD